MSTHNQGSGILFINITENPWIISIQKSYNNNNVNLKNSIFNSLTKFIRFNIVKYSIFILYIAYVYSFFLNIILYLYKENCTYYSVRNELLFMRREICFSINLKSRFNKFFSLKN